VFRFRKKASQFFWNQDIPQNWDLSGLVSKRYNKLNNYMADNEEPSSLHHASSPIVGSRFDLLNILQYQSQLYIAMIHHRREIKGFAPDSDSLLPSIAQLYQFPLSYNSKLWYPLSIRRNYHAHLQNYWWQLLRAVLRYLFIASMRRLQRVSVSYVLEFTVLFTEFYSLHTFSATDCFKTHSKCGGFLVSDQKKKLSIAHSWVDERLYPSANEVIVWPKQNFTGIFSLLMSFSVRTGEA